MLTTRRTALAFVLALVPACSAETSAGGPTTDSGSSSLDWQPLLTGDWQLDPGTEGYQCVRKTITEDVWVGAFRPVAPLGTHHTTLGFTEPGAPGAGDDGVSKCTGFDLGTEVLLGSGIGTKPMLFPDGVAVKIPAGKQLILNLHLFNTSDSPLTGTSGVEVARVDPSKIVNEAQLVFAGKTFGLTVPPGHSTQTGTCTIQNDVTIFSAFPHMHKLGRHLMSRAVPQNGTPTTLIDRDYSFDDQTYEPVAALSLGRGDKIEVNCTYENPGSSVVNFGQSSNDEMCFSGAYWYPAVYKGVICADVPPPADCEDVTAPGLEVLATGQATPAILTVDGTSVYWVNSAGNTVAGSAMKVPLAGGDTTILASQQDGPWGIAVDATSAYWTNFMDGTVMKSPLEGGTPTTLASGQQGPNAIAIDSTSAYWTNYNDGTIVKLPLAGGTPSVLASGQNHPDTLAVDATNVYWTNNGDGTVMKVALAGGTTTTVASGQANPQGIAVDATNVYWVNHNEGSVMKAPVAGGPPEVLAPGNGPSPDWSDIATDGTSVYWVSGADSAVMKVPAAGGAPTTLVSGHHHPTGIAVDGTSVYWTDGCGRVVKFSPK